MRDLRLGVDCDPMALLDEIGAAERLAVADPAAIDLLGAFAAALLRPAIARRHPEVASLGFFLRRSELTRLAELATASSPATVRVPRGVVFHVPPANVDTVFVYSWALSFVCGNANVVRVSERSAGAATTILETLFPLLEAADPRVTASQRFVSMGHDDPGFAVLSRGADLRVIWGGDAAVAAVRRHPLAPRSTELTFPDRSSMAVLDAGTVASMDDDRLARLATDFVNDVWWFDQAACSSPRTLVWIGDDHAVAGARDRMFDAVEHVLEAQGKGDDPAMAMQRRVSLYGAAIDGDVTHLDLRRPRIALARTDHQVRGWWGVGGFVEVVLPSLMGVGRLVASSDQTITHAGFELTELEALVRSIGGRGIDRVVPVGEALQFGRHWDGHDLLSSMTRWVVVRGSRT